MPSPKSKMHRKSTTLPAEQNKRAPRDLDTPHGMDDDIREAYAEGEPSQTGRQHGRPIDKEGVPMAERVGESQKQPPESPSQPGEGGKIGHDYESGRQDAME